MLRQRHDIPDPTGKQVLEKVRCAGDARAKHHRAAEKVRDGW